LKGIYVFNPFFLTLQGLYGGGEVVEIRLKMHQFDIIFSMIKNMIVISYIVLYGGHTMYDVATTMKPAEVSAISVNALVCPNIHV